MATNRKDKIHGLLKGIETGDAASVTVVNEDKYIQHNPQTHEGSLGLAALFRELAKTSPRVNIVRIFADGDFVFAHTEYDFDNSSIGFEIFRFEGEQAVEHWDNIQPRKGPNLSGHSMVDGSVQVTDLQSTESNREIVNEFVDQVLIQEQLEKLDDYLDDSAYTEHNPQFGDDLNLLRAALSEPVTGGPPGIQYQKKHRILAEGNFVLSVCEGSANGVHSAFYDLFRVDEGKIVEHWDTTEAIPPRGEWKNDNGKF